jgi:actin-related protein 4
MAAAKTVPVAGDDIGAAVIDCGSWLIRVGASGDDAPKALLSSGLGVPAPPAPRLAGDRVLLSPKAFSDIAPIYALDASGSASVVDWDGMQAVWQAGATQIGIDFAAAPLMIVEPTRAWDDTHRAKALERAFEGCGVPAAYLGRGSAMAAFASARTTACVLDVGHQGSVAVPVVDGYSLQKTTMRSVVGGHYLGEELHHFANAQLGIEGSDPRIPLGSAFSRIRGIHEVRRRRKADAPASETDDLETGPVRRFDAEDLSVKEPQKSYTDSHRCFYRLQVIHDFKSSTFRVSPGPSGASSPTPAAANGEGASGDVTMTDAVEENGSGGEANGGHAAAAAIPKGEKDGKDADREKEREREIEKSKEKERYPSLSTTYELPDGNVIDVSKGVRDGPHLADVLFDNGTAKDTSRRAISNMVYDAISACDFDMRRELYSGIVLTGGCSLIPGTIERFTRELAILTPQLFKMKILASQTALERTSGPWIGGSIVSSLGTFQQAWVSKAEYDELGSTGALRKCP